MAHSKRFLSSTLLTLSLVMGIHADTRAEDDTRYPLVLAGDGMTLVIQAREGQDPVVVTGTMRVTTSEAWPFTAHLRRNAAGGAAGAGEVRAGQRRVPFTITQDGQGGTRVVLAGRTYTVVRRGTSVRPGARPNAPTARRAPAAERTLRFAPHKITNGKIEGRPFHSHTVLVPKGWRVVGGAHIRPAAFLQVLPSVRMSVGSPDGREVYIAPQITALDTVTNGQRPALYSPVNGYIAAPKPTGVQQIAQDMARIDIPGLWQGATAVRITNTTALPEYRELLLRMIAPFRAHLAQQQATARMSGLPIKFFMDAAAYGIEGEFTLGGQRYEFLRVMSMWWTGNSSPTGHDVSWQTIRDITFKAPKGDLEKNMMTLRTIAESVRPTPQWHQVVARQARLLSQTRSNIDADNRRTFKRINKINTTTSSQIQEIIKQGYAKRTHIEDQTQAKVIRAIQETSVIVMPGTDTPLEVSMHWQGIYSNGEELILTMDPTYEPGPGWSPVPRRN